MKKEDFANASQVRRNDNTNSHSEWIEDLAVSLGVMAQVGDTIPVKGKVGMCVNVTDDGDVVKAGDRKARPQAMAAFGDTLTADVTRLRVSWLKQACKNVNLQFTRNDNGEIVGYTIDRPVVIEALPEWDSDHNRWNGVCIGK